MQAVELDHTTGTGLPPGTDLAAEVLTLADPAAVREALDRAPYVTHYGFGGSRHAVGGGGISYTIAPDALQPAREVLFEPHVLREIATARLWIRHRTSRLKEPSRRHSSYGHKHRAERWGKRMLGDEHGYVANGSFIVAALIEGCIAEPVMKPSLNMRSANAWLNLRVLYPKEDIWQHPKEDI